MITRGHQGEIDRFVRASPIHRPPILAAVQRFAAELSAGTRLLDAGAGRSPYRPLFAHCEYVSHDWSASPHERASSAEVIGDLCDLPVPDASFDAVLCTEVLEHVETPWIAARELFRVLRPEGRVLVTVPFVAQLHEEPHDHFRYTSYGIRGLLEGAGFTVATVEPLTGYFGTMAHLLRVEGLATRRASGRSRVATRLLALVAQALSLVLTPIASVLDERLDERKALPLGWVLEASKVQEAGSG